MEKLTHRYIARIKVEASTPLFVGSGAASLVTDSLVQKDHLGLPIIPGTSIAGVLRHALEDFSKGEVDWNDVFGYQGDGNEGLGSRLLISSAYFLNGKGKVSEGFNNEVSDEVKTKLQKLPTRQHVHITHKGVAEDKGLFDHEVLYKGARFIFEMELKGTKEDEESWKELMEKIKNPAFRVGQGTRNGYGNLRVSEVFDKTYDLEDNFEDYLNFKPSLNGELDFDPVDTDTDSPNYKLQLKPDDFFIFSEGFGDTEVDNKPVEKDVMEYKDGKIRFTNKTLIPASSIKGAIAHRVAFHYNKLQGFYADEINSEVKKYIEENNQAVAKLFGKKGEIDKETKKNTGQRGILILDDLYYDDVDNEKIFNHVAIDRFTGGGIDGALFSEKVSHLKNEEDRVVLKINLSQPIDSIDQDIIKTLENTLLDISNGLLPLGGMVTKGHGMFTGTLLKGDKEITEYHTSKKEEA